MHLYSPANPEEFKNTKKYTYVLMQHTDMDDLYKSIEIEVLIELYRHTVLFKHCLNVEG